MSNWKHSIDRGNGSDYIQMAYNLRYLKEHVVKWNVLMWQEREAHLLEVEENLEHLFTV